MSAADLDRALGDRERILLDTSALIAFHNHQEAVHPLARHLLGRIEREDDPMTGAYSAVSAAELLIRPLRAGPMRYAFMHTFLVSFPHLAVLPVDLTVAIEAASLRARTNVRLPDALVIASGLLAGCEAIVSNDDTWRRRIAPLFPQFQWLCLGDYRDA